MIISAVGDQRPSSKHVADPTDEIYIMHFKNASDVMASDGGKPFGIWRDALED